MWGHRVDCPCGICKTFFRLFSLVRSESSVTGFVENFGGRLEELYNQSLGVSTRVHGRVPDLEPPFVPLVPATASGPPVLPPGTSYLPAEKFKLPLQELRHPIAPGLPPPVAFAPPAQPASSTGPHQCLGSKAAPASPPHSGKQPVLVKREPEESPQSKRGPVVDAQDLESLPDRKGKKEKKKKKKEKKQKSVSPPPKASGSRIEERSRSRKGQAAKRRESYTPSPERSKKKARGDSVSPERDTPRRGERREEGSPRQPRSPSHPPPNRGPQREQGKGWRGSVPYSSHPRWTHSKNKGIVKRAKQELFNRKGRGKGHHPRREPDRDHRRHGR